MTVEQDRVYGPETKQTVIDRIIAKDRKAFESWVGHKNHKNRLDLTPQAVRYLIPPSVFQLAEKPDHVEVRIVANKKNNLNFFVVEANSGNIKTDGIGGYASIAVEEARENGPLRDTDFFLNHIKLRTEGNGSKILKVVSYGDREDSRGKGIASGFYQRLRNVAIKTGFDYILGLNDPDNIAFFKDKLGRVTLPELPEFTIKEVFPGSYALDSMADYTVDVLSPGLLGYSQRISNSVRRSS